MLDERMRMMLEVANTLTAEELEFLRADSVGVAAVATEAKPARAKPRPAEPPPVPVRTAEPEPPDVAPVAAPVRGVSRGEYERSRARDSKVSTARLGNLRAAHNWWPIGTELFGRIGTEVFGATVVENRNVKSGRSLLITSGAAKDAMCITPTRAALEATETYRRDHNLGRGGGVTNGWMFWQPVNQ